MRSSPTPATITASIGVVGGKFATTDMWNKIGISWNANHRGANAAILSSDAVFSHGGAQENGGLDERHLRRVQGARGRGPRHQAQEPIDELAGGRVFTGRQALELGLIDKIGTLDDAIHYAADKAKIKEYQVRVYPEPKNFIELLMEDLSDGDRDSNHLEVGTWAPLRPPRPRCSTWPSRT